VDIDEVEEQSRDTWLHHAHTYKQKRRLDKDVDVAYIAFMAACRATVDPDVARAHSTWVTRRAMSKLFSKEEKKNG
jgi:hypothetical protein